ncbi:MAG: hypothetical protein AMXMBFR36_04140 [Acidobacteriota bacterium]
MSLRSSIGLSAVIPLLLGGCISSIKVQKVDPTKSPQPAGIRYSLPQSGVLVRLDPDPKKGWLVEVVQVPDTSRRYAIDAWTLLGKFTLNVSKANELLTQVQFTADDTAVAKQTFDSAGALLAKEAEIEAGAAKAAETRQAELAKSVAEAERALAAAQADLRAWERILEANPTAENKKARLLAEAAVEKAADSLARAKVALEEHSRANASLFAAPAKGQGGSAGGPLLLLLRDSVDPAKCASAENCPGSVGLVAVEWKAAATPPPIGGNLPVPTYQRFFDVRKPSPGSAEAKRLALALSGSSIAPSSTSPSFWTVALPFDAPIPLTSKISAMSWRSFSSQAGPVALMGECSATVKELPQSERSLPGDMIERVWRTAESNRLILHFPRVCFPDGYYELTIQIQDEGGTLVFDYPVTIFLCDGATCARRERMEQ